MSKPHPVRIKDAGAGLQEVVDAFNALRLGLGFGECGQEHSGQNCNDGDDD